ncbi:MAG: pentapeptide repeat-containing protein [Desulfobaccales bacterium]
MVNFFRKAPHGYRLIRVTLTIFCLVMVFLVLIFIIVKVPQWEVQNSGLELKDQMHQENENRRTVAQIIGGVFVLVGLYIAWVRSKAMRDQAEVDWERQLTDLYVKAIEQLGSENLQIRLGGIYALERIARESAKDHWPIMEVLTAFVRENAPLTKVSTTENPERSEIAPHPEKPPTDIQAVLTVLGRTAIDYAQEGETRFLDLRATNLTGADLRLAKLQGVILEQADLQKALLMGINLNNAALQEANLQEAVLIGANLQKAYLGDANLEKAIIILANLQGAYLGGAILRRADLMGSNLQSARFVTSDLQGAKLSARLNEVDLAGANIKGADLARSKGLTAEQVGVTFYDATTKWPEGFTPPRQT